MLHNVLRDTKHLIKSNATTILTAVGVSGTVTTAYLAGKASFTACRVIDNDEDRGGISPDPKQRFKERFRLVWKLYIPAGVTGATTIAAIVGSSKLSNRRAAAAISAYSLSERAFTEYREKVIEQIGENKESRLRDEIAQDRVTNNPSKEVIVAGDGKVLCCELWTGRYFESDMETLRKAVNDVNAEMIYGYQAPLSEFYNRVGLPETSQSMEWGWDTDKLLELSFSATLTSDQKPCIAFSYNYVKYLN